MYVNDSVNHGRAAASLLSSAAAPRCRLRTARDFLDGAARSCYGEWIGSSMTVRAVRLSYLNKQYVSGCESGEDEGYRVQEKHVIQHSNRSILESGSAVRVGKCTQNVKTSVLYLFNKTLVFCT